MEWSQAQRARNMFPTSRQDPTQAAGEHAYKELQRKAFLVNATRAFASRYTTIC